MYKSEINKYNTIQYYKLASKGRIQQLPCLYNFIFARNAYNFIKYHKFLSTKANHENKILHINHIQIIFSWSWILILNSYNSHR